MKTRINLKTDKTKSKNRTLIIATIYFVICACHRVEGCHLDSLNLSGDIVKVETIVQSEIPFTEMFCDKYNPSYNYSETGDYNSTIIFNRAGYIIRHIGYGIDGKELFNVPYIKSKGTLAVGFFGQTDKINYSVIPHMDSLGRVLYQEILINGKHEFNCILDYDERGNITKIKKVFPVSKVAIDSTVYNYLSFDKNGNWTEMEILYKGLFDKQNYTAKTKRRITYRKEPKQQVLISELQNYNAKEQKAIAFTGGIVDFENIVNVKIPANFVFNKEGSFNKPYHKQWAYLPPDKDKYVGILVSIMYGDFPATDRATVSLLNDPSMRKDIEEILYADMLNNDVHVFSWQEIGFVGGKTHLKYYRYSNNSPIPVLVDSYASQNGYRCVSIQVACQADCTYQYSEIFREVAESFNIYN